VAIAKIAALVGLTVVYAVCFMLIKAGLAFAPPLLFGGLRALIGGVALLGVAPVFHEPLLPRPATWSSLLALALTSTALAYGAMFLSPGRTGAGLASVLGNTQPLMAVALAALFLGERITGPHWATLALGLAGVALISLPALAASGADGVSGAALALAASLGAASGSVIFKRLGAQTPVLTVTAWQLILGSLPLLALSAIVERGATVTWSAPLLGTLLFLALPGTALANAVWYWLVRRHAVGRLTMYLFLVPIFGLGLGALAFGERIGPWEGLGSGLVIAGIGAATSWIRPPSDRGG